MKVKILKNSQNEIISEFIEIMCDNSLNDSCSPLNVTFGDIDLHNNTLI